VPSTEKAIQTGAWKTLDT